MSTIISVVTPTGIVQATDSRASAAKLPKKVNPAAKLTGLRYYIDGIPRTWAGRHAVAGFVSTATNVDFLRELEAHMKPYVGEGADVIAEGILTLLRRHTRTSAVVTGYTDVGGVRTPQIWKIKGGERRLINAGGVPGIYVGSYDELFRRMLCPVAVPKKQGIPLGEPQEYIPLEPILDPTDMSIQDAIDLSIFYIHATETLERLRKRGAFSGVGGAIDVTVITADGTRISRVPIVGSGEAIRIHETEG